VAEKISWPQRFKKKQSMHSFQSCNAPYAKTGFTLVELIVVIVLVGILSALGGTLVTRHMESYVAMSRRAELVDSAEQALRRMQRDIRAALPNSIALFNGQRGLCLLHAADGGRYRARGPGDALSFNSTDTSFAVIGHLHRNEAGLIDPTVHNGSVVVYNTGQYPANAYNGTNISPVTDVLANNATDGSDRIELASRSFPYASPQQRFFIVDSQVRYVMDPAAETLRRYERNSTAITNPSSSLPGDWGQGALVARHVTNSTFTYLPGTPTRSGMVTLRLSLADEGEQVSLLHQVHVLNAP